MEYKVQKSFRDKKYVDVPSVGDLVNELKLEDFVFVECKLAMKRFNKTCYLYKIYFHYGYNVGRIMFNTTLDENDVHLLNSLTNIVMNPNDHFYSKLMGLDFSPVRYWAPKVNGLYKNVEESFLKDFVDNLSSFVLENCPKLYSNLLMDSCELKLFANTIIEKYVLDNYSKVVPSVLRRGSYFDARSYKEVGIFLDYYKSCNSAESVKNLCNDINHYNKLVVLESDCRDSLPNLLPIFSLSRFVITFPDMDRLSAKSMFNSLRVDKSKFYIMSINVNQSKLTMDKELGDKDLIFSLMQLSSSISDYGIKLVFAEDYNFYYKIPKQVTPNVLVNSTLEHFGNDFDYEFSVGFSLQECKDTYSYHVHRGISLSRDYYLKNQDIFADVDLLVDADIHPNAGLFDSSVF